MNTQLIMLIFCFAAQRAYSKTLFDYNINPEYDLVAEESAGYSRFQPSAGYFVAPQLHYKHYAANRGYGNDYEMRKHEPTSYGFDYFRGYNYHHPSPKYGDEIYHSFHSYHPHNIPPGQARKHGHAEGHAYVIPPRFPPPPVYDKNFINPWTIVETTPKPLIFQEPSLLTTPRTAIAQQPIPTTPKPYVAPKVTTRKSSPITTPAPSTSTTTDDQLLYDIDVRFGRA